MALDSRPRPVRRSARRRVPLLTALALLVMAAGLWFAGAAAASGAGGAVPAPRLQVAEARVAAAEQAAVGGPAPQVPEEAPSPPVTGAAPVVGPVVAVPAAVSPAVPGPRAPPRG